MTVPVNEGCCGDSEIPKNRVVVGPLRWWIASRNEKQRHSGLKSAQVTLQFEKLGDKTFATTCVGVMSS